MNWISLDGSDPKSLYCLILTILCLRPYSYVCIVFLSTNFPSSFICSLIENVHNKKTGPVVRVPIARDIVLISRHREHCK